MKFPTQLYGDYFISQYKDPVINQPGFNGMSFQGFGSRCSIELQYRIIPNDALIPQSSITLFNIIGHFQSLYASSIQTAHMT